MRLKDKIAIVTGGGAGIGEAVAKRYAREGAKVVLAEINDTTGQAVEAAIRKAGGEALFVHTDVAQESDIQRVVSKTLERHGHIDVLFNNAAIAIYGQDTRAHELSNEVWHRTLAVNLTGYWLCAKYVLPSMLKQGWGVIINLASPTGMLGFQGITAYSTSKGGVFALTRAMAADYGSLGIRVNAIVPGTIDTPMNAEEFADPAIRQHYIGKAPAGRLGVGDDIAGVAVYLGSDDSSYCVGGVFTVDGGLTAAV
jgi:NAD(P)-dependent dehydrogenase (short-subunit alcohol dehydrogenase family)